MGRQVTHLVPGPIYVYRCTWPSGRNTGSYFGPYTNTKFKPDSFTTIAAFIKVESGTPMTSHWFNGYTESDIGSWKLCGLHMRSAGGGYTNCHPYAGGPDSAVTFLVALPAVVDGYVDLSEPQNWWFFKNQSGGWG